MSGKKTKFDEYCLTHNLFFEETFKMPSLGIAFLKKTLPQKLLRKIDLEKLTVEKTKFCDDFSVKRGRTLFTGCRYSGQRNTSVFM